MAGKTWILFVATLLLTSFYVKCEEDSEKAEEAVPIEPVESTGNDGESGIADVKEEDDVLVLTNDNFDTVISKHTVVLVEFYAPWCGHCKSLAPEYAAAAKTLKDAVPPVPLAKVDCIKEEALGKRFDVSGYPTLKIFRDGAPEDYDGPREEEGIVKYMKEKSDPNYKPPPEAVLTLTKDNFKELTDKTEFMLVEFYAPWCGHCKKIAPELEKAAKALKEKKLQVEIGKVDATIESELAKEYGVTGYPTMFTFRKGKKGEYKGPREAEGIEDYLIKHTGIATTLHATLKDVKSFISGNGDVPVFLGVFDDENDPLMKVFIEANDELRDDYTFGHTFSKDVKKMFAMKKESAVVVVHPEYLISKYEKRYQFFTEGSAVDLQDFYKTKQCPLVGHLQSDTEKSFKKRPFVVVFYDVDFSPKVRSLTQFWRNKVVNVAKEFPDMLFAVAKEESFEDKLKEFGLHESGEDVNVGIYAEDGRKYALVDEEFSEDTLTEFIEQFKKGELKPHLKSQPPQPIVPPGNVQVVVANNFDDIVMDETKEVFIEFYAPWCGHCKAIAKDIVKLAKELKVEKGITIAKMDATANDIPPTFKVEGFPTIYYVKPGKKKEPILMEGDRNLNSLKNFVNDNSDLVGMKKKKGKDEL